MSPAPQGEDHRSHTNYATLKGGVYAPSTGIVASGYIINLALGHHFSRLFAVELEVGYLANQASPSSAIRNLWGIPIMANARLSLPVWILEAYGGAGLGTMYYDVEGALTGADLALADRVTLGLEAKYYMIEDVGALDLDAIAAFLTLGIRF